MRLSDQEAWQRVRGSDHGILGTIHPERGVDMVPVVYAVHGNRIVIPVDTVKPKATTRLQRLENLAADSRCTLLVEHYDDDWSRLWWVRINGEAREAKGPEIWPALRQRFPQYVDEGSIAGGIALAVTAITGWSANG